MSDTAMKRWRRAMEAWLASPIRAAEPPLPPIASATAHAIICALGVPADLALALERDSLTYLSTGAREWTR